MLWSGWTDVTANLADPSYPRNSLQAEEIRDALDGEAYAAKRRMRRDAFKAKYFFTPREDSY